jgi:hypothetical protein
MVRVSLLAVVVCLLCLPLSAGGSRVRADGRSPATATAGQLLISEFRLRGPGGVTDEYIEVFNTTGAAHTVAAASGSGYGIAASDGLTRCTIPNGTVIPDGGHFLCANSAGYSLSGYPSGSATTATPDATFTLDIPDNAGIALFNNSTGGAAYAAANRLDAAGSSSEPNAIYREGAGYGPVSAVGLQFAILRKTNGMCADATCGGMLGGAPAIAAAALADTNDNAADFIFVDTLAFSVGMAPHLGAPGPQNLGSPRTLSHSGGLVSDRMNACVSRDRSPNRVRDLTPGPAATSSLGTMEFRVRWTNNSGVDLTRLRFRIIDLTTGHPASGIADLRLLSVANVDVTLDSDYPCGSAPTTSVASGMQIETPPAQDIGGGYNSSLADTEVTPTSRLVNGVTTRVAIKVGVQQAGFARFCVVPETVPAVTAFPWCYIGSTDGPPVQTAANDFDFDRIADIPMYDNTTGQWRILRSSGGFATETDLASGPGVVPVPGDYDGDGRYDIATYFRRPGHWGIATSSSGYTRFIQADLGGPTCTPMPGDYDGDGATDIAVSCPGGWTFLTSASGFTRTVSFIFESIGWTPVPGQDFDGDGVSDVTFYNENAGVWYYFTSTSHFSTFFSYEWGGHGFTLVPGDYDGDGRADFGVYARATGDWYVLLSGGSTPYTTAAHANWGGPGFIPVAADYDGDRRIDLGVYQAATNQLIVLKSIASYTTTVTIPLGSTGVRPLSSAVQPASMRELKASDWDGEGLSELTVYNGSSGVWSTLYPSDNSGVTRAWGGSGYAAVPGDYDGDGRVDYGAYQAATGQWTVLLSGDSFTTSLTRSAGGAGWVPVPGDYDGDGKTDLVVYNVATGQWFGLKSSSNYTTTVNVSWGGAGYTATPGDFDGDGRIDLAVYQTATGNWAVLKSSTNYTTSITGNFGGAGYAPVPADFDGDGLTDFAVYQTATGVWTWLKSSSGNASGFTIAYGGAGYAPVAGDWDGDGSADVGVYNAASGLWSILLSNGNYRFSLARTWGGAGDAPVPTFP